MYVSFPQFLEPRHFFAQKIDQTFVENSMKMLETNREQVTQNPTLMTLLTYYLLSTADYNRLLLLLNKTRNPEL